MKFTDEQNTELGKKLDPKYVAQRKQGGSQVSYIEGWHAIAEANRIFGFDGWTRETVILNIVNEVPRKIGKDNPRDGWGVTYTAKVRVTVDGVVREGVGAGHGIDVDKGQAHESAIKEAETDAMKRALMTFGNPFGLALYDKTRANVGVDVAPFSAEEYDTLRDDIRDAQTLADLQEQKSRWQAAKHRMTPEQAKGLTTELATRHSFVAQAPNKAPPTNGVKGRYHGPEIGDAVAADAM